jgi:hypothetical protein
MMTIISNALRAVGHSSITVDATAGGVALEASRYSSHQAGGFHTTPCAALITTETADARYTLDGTAPTAAVGHLLESGSALMIEGEDNIANFRAFRTSGTSATFKVTFYAR